MPDWLSSAAGPIIAAIIASFMGWLTWNESRKGRKRTEAIEAAQKKAAEEDEARKERERERVEEETRREKERQRFVESFERARAVDQATFDQLQKDVKYCREQAEKYQARAEALAKRLEESEHRSKALERELHDERALVEHFREQVEQMNLRLARLEGKPLD